MGWVKDIVVDAYIMINGEKKDEDEEWKGLTQTLRRIIAKLIDDLYVSTTKEITKVITQLSTTNQEVKLVRDEIIATNQLIREEIITVREDINQKVE